MTSQANGGETASPVRTNQRTFVDEVVLTFSSPMAWLLVVALILTWSGVAIVLFDLLDYKTLAEYTSHCDDPVCLHPGLPPPAAVAKRGLRTRGVKHMERVESEPERYATPCRARQVGVPFDLEKMGGVRPIRSSPAAAASGDVTAQESTDWLEMMWAFAVSLLAPDDEEEGIHQLADTLTSFHSEEL